MLAFSSYLKSNKNNARFRLDICISLLPFPRDSLFYLNSRTRKALVLHFDLRQILISIQVYHEIITCFLDYLMKLKWLDIKNNKLFTFVEISIVFVWVLGFEIIDRFLSLSDWEKQQRFGMDWVKNQFSNWNYRDWWCFLMLVRDKEHFFLVNKDLFKDLQYICFKFETIYVRKINVYSVRLADVRFVIKRWEYVLYGMFVIRFVFVSSFVTLR